jgi:Tol biopolymer transport system component
MLARGVKTPDDRVVRFQIPVPGGLGEGDGSIGALAVSPDGHSIAFAAETEGRSGLWVRPLDAETARLLPGTDGANHPFWSPDGKWIVFAAHATLQRIDLSRLQLSKICDVHTFTGGSWLDDGRLLFAMRNEGLFVVDPSGGVPSPIALLDPSRGDVTYADPHVLPGGRLLYTVQSQQSVDVYAATVEQPARRRLLVRNGQSAWVAADRTGARDLVWFSGQTLLMQPIDLDALQLTGQPRTLADRANLASSGGPTLVYGSSLASRQFEWVDRTGKPLGTVGPPNTFVFSRLSPDDRRVATIRSGANADLWVVDATRGVANRLTAGHGIHIDPVWSPDGRTILFSFGAPFNISSISAEGAATETRVTRSAKNQYLTDWSHDGRFIIYDEAGAETGADIWTLAVTPDGQPAPGATPRPYVRAPFDQGSGRFSPDDRWVAYESNDSGQSEIYVQAFPQPREKYPVSAGGGRFPAWSADGRELYYVSNDRMLMAVAVHAAGGVLEAARPRELFRVPATLAGAPYEVSRDDRRFLTSVTVTDSQPLNVIVNWPALLKRTAP